jgi:hypothetical protein
MLLYKFRSISGISFRYTQDVFVNSRLFLPTANILNDPNEGVAIVDIQNQYCGWGNYIEERNRRQRIRVCAFTETHRNPVVWSHYADEHRGICIEFDTDHIDIRNNLLDAVIYSNTVPTLKPNSWADERLSFLNKTKEWAYEKEWRYIVKEDSSFLTFNDSAIKRLLLGTRFQDDDLEWVDFWLSHYTQKRSVPVVKMKFASTDYSLYEESEMRDKTERLG